MSCLVLVSTCLGFLFAVSLLSWIMASKLCFGKPLHPWGSWQISEVVWRERETTRLESCPAGWLAIRLDSISPSLVSKFPISTALHISPSPVANHQLHIIVLHDEQVQTPPPASFKSSQSNLCLIPSWPQFSEYLITNIPRRKRQLNYFPLINTLPWQFTFSSTDFTFFIHLQSVMIDVKAFFHWKRSILRVLLYRGQRAWEEKGDSQRETWLLGLKLVNTNPHIGSKYCLYLNWTLTPILNQILLHWNTFILFIFIVCIPPHHDQNPL